MLRFALALALAGCSVDVLPESYECYYDDPCGTGEITVKPAGISIVCASDTDEARDLSDENLSKNFSCAVKSYGCHVLEDGGACFF